MATITIRNKATDQTYNVTEKAWEEMKSKKQPGDERYTMSQLFDVVTMDERKALDKTKIPAEFKRVDRSNKGKGQDSQAPESEE